MQPKFQCFLAQAERGLFLQTPRLELLLEVGFEWPFERLKVFPLGIIPTLKLLADRETADVKEITIAVRPTMSE